jgi:multicomponent K+:H+ antiporter subunit G
MTGFDLPALQIALICLLLLAGAGITFIGAFGLVRLRRSFYERVHAPTLGTTLGTISIAFASLIYFSVITNAVSVHELLIVFFVTITTPVSLVILVKAASLRDASETKGNDR